MRNMDCAGYYPLGELQPRFEPIWPIYVNFAGELNKLPEHKKFEKTLVKSCLPTKAPIPYGEIRPGFNLPALRDRYSPASELRARTNLAPMGVVSSRSDRWAAVRPPLTGRSAAKVRGSRLANAPQVQLTGTQQGNLVDFDKAVGGRDPEIRESGFL